jgi:hypothetical protein
MQRTFRLSVLCLIAGAAMSACQPEEVIVTPAPNVAGVRFINALPDSAGAFGLDFRFVDLVENSTQFRVPFRNSPTTTSGVTASSGVQYKAAEAGSRHFVIFLDDTLQSIASVKLKDSTLSLTAGKNYTVIIWGAARAGQMKVSVIDETIADPGPGKVALRLINATPAAIDGRAFLTAGTAPATATWANVAPYSASAFVTSDTGSITYNVQPAGGGANLFGNMTALLGARATSSAGALGKLDIEPIPGTRVAGSAVSLVVYPPSTVGSKAPQGGAFANTAGSFIWDRRPPRGW